MGQGGHLLIINETDYDWKRIKQGSYQMADWDFPNVIKKHTSVKVYIEFQYKLFYEQDDSGYAIYEINGTNNRFTINADYKDHNRKVFVIYDTFQTEEGNRTNIGWVHDGTMIFYLNNHDTSFYSTSKYWMKNQMNVIGNKTLCDICIVGSHDSGMSVFNGGTSFASEDNTVTQTHNIKGQLERGARYFDIRPVITGGKFGTGHYSHVGDFTWQGGNGEYISQIIDGINKFTSDIDCRELIILNLSHTLNTDLGNNSYREFSTEEWIKLNSEFSKLKYLYGCDKNNSITTIPLNNILENKPAIVIILNGKNIPYDLPAGFYRSTDFNIYDEYSGTNNVNVMKRDQLRKMKEYSPDQYFLLSWTLTQSEQQTILGPSILKIAEDAIRELPSLPQECNESNYPNVLYTDKISYSLQAHIANVINLNYSNKKPLAMASDGSYIYPKQTITFENSENFHYFDVLPEKFWTKVQLSLTNKGESQYFEINMKQSNSSIPIYNGRIYLEDMETKYIEFSPNSQCEITVNGNMSCNGDHNILHNVEIELEGYYKNMASKTVSWGDRTAGTSRIDDLFLKALGSNTNWYSCEIKIKGQRYTDVTGVMVALITDGEWYYPNHPEQWKILWNKDEYTYSYLIEKNTPLCAIGYITNHIGIGGGADVTLTGYYEEGK